MRAFTLVTSRRHVVLRKAWSIATMIGMLVSTIGTPIFVPTVKAQTAPVGQGFVIADSDLRFIFHHKPTEKKVVTGVEMFRKLLDSGVAGDNVGVLLRGVEKTDVERGQVLAKPGTIKPHTKFKGEVYILSKEEGGRHTPFFSGYRPQFYIRTTDVTGILKLPEGVEMVMPGDNTSITGELITPVAIEKGGRFAIREGGRTVGSGTITEIVE